MVDLGEIARQAGVRPPLPDGEAKKSTPNVSIASGTAVANPPILHEPSPISATPTGSVDTVTGVTAQAEERTAERSASAVDLYERAAREADAASKIGKSNRATSTPPESAVVAAMAPVSSHHQAHATHPPVNSPHLHVPHVHAHAHHHQSAPTPMPGQDPLQRSPSNDSSPGTDPSPASQASTNIIPEHYRYPVGAQTYQGHAGSPTMHMIHSPSSMTGHFSTSSSPSYIQHHQQQQQPMYAYHTQLYAPQYSYPPPIDNPASIFAASGLSNNGQAVPGSPIQQQGSMLSSPHTFSPPTFFYTAASPMPQLPQSRAGQAPVSQHQQSSSEESSSSEQHPSSDATSLNQHQQQFSNHNGGMQYPQQMSMQPTYVQYAPYGQPGMQYVAFSPQPSQHSFASYDMSQQSPNPTMSPIMSGSFGAPSSARNSIDYSAMQQSQYRQVPFNVQGQYPSSQPMYGQQHLRYSTAGTDASSIYPYPLNTSIGSASGYHQQQQHMQHHNQALHMSQPAPTELARGHLAQAKLRDAAGAYDPNSRLPLSQSERRRRSTGADQRLPRPPAHSPWALWVGNVPSDATHAELWRFFSTRPPPGFPGPGTEEEKDMLEAEAMFPDLPKPDYNGVGIDSIHLISRSNCCFVNMASKRHLDHAILVCNGLSLRPADPRCKNLVCRVRKKDDDTKTGVGAQRGKGMHQAWVEEQERLRSEMGPTDDSTVLAAGLPATIGDSPKTDKHDQHKASASTSHSASTSSTSSSFLTRHFPKRYFIIKSHTEEDLHLSVERGIWATQSHNEPVLDQAFRTSGSVFLIFGANKSGEFFGYAKMASPIVKQEHRTSWMARTEAESSGSSGHKSSSSGRPAEPSIPEVDESAVQDTQAGNRSLGVPGASASTRPVFSPSASHLVANSPQPISDNPSPSVEAHSKSADNKQIDYLNVRAHMTDPVSPGPIQSQEIRRGDSLDPRLLSKMQRMDINVISPASASGVADQLAAGSSNAKAVEDDDGVVRKDTALSPEERNARLEILDKEEEAAHIAAGKVPGLQDIVEHGSSKPFKVEWVRVQRLPFHRTRHLRNSFNGNREVKISRDGTEIEPNVGASLLELFWKDPNLDLGASTASRAPQPIASPTPEVHAF